MKLVACAIGKVSPNAQPNAQPFGFWHNDDTYVGKGYFLLFRGPFTDDDTLPNRFSFEPVKGFRGRFRLSMAIPYQLLAATNFKSVKGLHGHINTMALFRVFVGDDTLPTSSR